MCQAGLSVPRNSKSLLTEEGVFKKVAFGWGWFFFFEDRVWFESTECVGYHRFLKHENLMQVCGSIWRGTKQQ